MASTKEIRRRIKSVKSTLQITKAMELIASLKMKKATTRAQKARDYAGASWQLIASLSTSKEIKSALLQVRRVKKILVVVVASDRGLCGSYNSDVFRKTAKYINELKEEGIDIKTQVELIAVGRKTASYLNKLGLTVVADFEKMEDVAEYLQTTPITKLALDGFLKGAYDRVVFIYSHFVSSMRRVPTAMQILPIDPNANQNEEFVPKLENLDTSEFEFEPSAQEIVDVLLPKTVRTLVFQTILEANASEHSARMVAMKNATDAGRDLVTDLEFTFNQLRQQSITAEIAEISSGAMTLN